MAIVDSSSLVCNNHLGERGIAPVMGISEVWWGKAKWDRGPMEEASAVRLKDFIWIAVRPPRERDALTLVPLVHPIAVTAMATPAEGKPFCRCKIGSHHGYV